MLLNDAVRSYWLIKFGLTNSNNPAIGSNCSVVVNNTSSIKDTPATGRGADASDSGTDAITQL